MSEFIEFIERINMIDVAIGFGTGWLFFLVALLLIEWDIRREQKDDR